MKFARRFEGDLQDVGREEFYFRYSKVKKSVHLACLKYPSDFVAATPSTLEDIKDQISLFNPSSINKYTKKYDYDVCFTEATEYLQEILSDREKTERKASIRLSDYLALYVKVIEFEIRRVDTFAKELLRELIVLKSSVLENLLLLLKSSNLAQHVDMEYIFRLENEEMMAISSFGNLIFEVQSLLKFLFVNSAAFKRMDDKLQALLNLAGQENFLASKEHRYDVLDIRTAAVNQVKLELEKIAGELMCSSSCYYEYLNDHLRSLETLSFRTKLTRFESERPFKKLSKVLDLEAHIRPHQFLTTYLKTVFVTLCATYFITYVDKNNTVFDERGYFISASLDQQPASNIGSFGLNISLGLIGLVIFVKHKIVKKQLRERSWMATHRVSCVVGIIAIICGMGVAAFQCRAFPTTHNVFAASFFLLTTLHILLETNIEWANKLSSPSALNLRLGITVVILVAVAVFLTSEGYILSHLETISHQRRMRLRAVGAIFELLGFFAIVAYFGTFYTTFLDYRFQLHVYRQHA